MAQQFSVLLLTDAGSDAYAPDVGGGIQALLLSTTTAGDMEGVATAAIISTEDQIKNAQASVGMRLDAAERLASAALLSIEPIIDADGMVSGASMNIAISTFANRAVSHPVNLKV